MVIEKEETLNILNEILKTETNIEEKKYVLNLKKIYLKNMKMNNPGEIENIIYKGKNNKEKFYFELKRIKDYLSLIPNEQIEKDLKVLYAKEHALIKKEKNEDKIYQQLLLNIIYIETRLRMKIGLVTEFDNYINYYIESFTKKNILNFDNDINIEEKIKHNKK